MNLPTARTYGLWLALFRIFTGIFWLAHGVPKFLMGAKYLPPTGFIEQFLQQAILKSPPFYQAFLSVDVIPHPGIFAEMVRLGEVLVGASLLFGFFSRLGGLGGMFLSANYFLANGGWGSFVGLGSLDASAFAMSALNFVLPTGRILGIDGLLKKPPREKAIVPEFVDETTAQAHPT
jgi:uncharacterized membrane protein YphA (DoxX/SURF4 family)